MAGQEEFQWLCQEAGLPSECAERMATEGLNLKLLHRGKLNERRDVFRGMGLTYGQIMSINRALERWEPDEDMEDEAEEEEEEEHAAEPEQSEEDADTVSETADSESYEMVDQANGAGEVAAQPSVPPKLQAAALLLAGAGRQTLMGLGLYLGNAISQPDKAGFRTIQLTNPLFQERIWSVPGGASLLRAAGFSEGPSQTLRLAEDAPLQPVIDAKELVDRLLLKSPPERQPAAPAAPGEFDAGCGNSRASLTSPVLADGAASPTHVARRRKQLAQSMRSIEAMVEDAHTCSWDAALASSYAIDPRLLSAHEVRCCRACNQGRLAALLGRLLRPLWKLTAPSGAEHAGPTASASRTRLLNLLLVVTRLMPILLEQQRDAGIGHMLWTPLAVSPVAGVGELAAPPASPRVKPAAEGEQELAVGSTAGGGAQGATAGAPAGEDASDGRREGGGPAAVQQGGVCPPPRSLGHCLNLAVIRSLFVPGFSVMVRDSLTEDQADNGAHANVWDPSSATLDEARQAGMRALLACCSASLFVPPHALAASPNRMLLATVNAPQPYAKALFRALFSVVFSYDPVGLGIPYAHSLVPDSHYTVMHVAAQLLMVLLSQPAAPPPSAPAAPAAGPRQAPEASSLPRAVPTAPPGPPPAAPPPPLDKMSRLLVALQRPETLRFLVGGFRLLLRNGYASRRTYLPSALVALHCQQELLLLLWRFLSLNRPFCELLVDAEELADVVLALGYFVLSWRDEPSKHSWVHLAILCLLLLSSEEGFGSTVNLPCPHTLPLPAGHAGACKGSVADLLVVCCHDLLHPSKERLESMLPAALAVLANISPHVKAFSAGAATMVLDIVLELAEPSFLYAADTRPELLIAALDVVSSSLLYQHSANLPLELAIYQAADRLRAIPPAAPTLATGPPNAPLVDTPVEARGDVRRAVTAVPARADAAPAMPDVPEWHARLPLQIIFRFLDVLEKKAGKNASTAAIQSTLRGVSLAGVLPPPPPIVIRRYVPNAHSQTWLTQMLWGVVYTRNQETFEPKRIKLVPIMQVPGGGH